MSFHGELPYVIEPADAAEEPVVLPVKRRTKTAVGSYPPPTRAPAADDLDCSTIVTWPPPSRPPAPCFVEGITDETSDGIPVEISERETMLLRCNGRRR